MAELVYIVTTLFVAYVIYVMVTDKKTSSDVFISQDKPEAEVLPPVAAATSKPERVVSSPVAETEA
ncbi:MAG: hypothetical protein PHY16_03395 [Methylobacter sp.]|nr:hypothetical protein [Methylobacter sp.]